MSKFRKVLVSLVTFKDLENMAADL
jgi:hypothetical protein